MRSILVGLRLGIVLPWIAVAAQTPRRQPVAGGSYAGTPFAPPTRVTLRSPSVSVPLVREGGFYFVDVQLNGRPFRFTLETGAGFFGVSQRAARALNLTIDSVEAVQGSRTPVVRIDSLRLGDALLQGLVARVNPAWDGGAFDGIVSASVLRTLLATLDLGGNSLRLEQGSLPEPNGRDILAVVGQDRGGRVDIPIVLNGTAIPAVLDTRSSYWIIAPDSLQSQLSLATQPTLVTTAYGPSQGAFELRGARMNGSASIGGATIERPAVLLRNRPGTVLGVPLLEQFTITLDQQNGRVRMSRGGDRGIVTMPRQAWEETGGIAAGSAPTAGAVSAAPAASVAGAEGGPVRRAQPGGGGEPPSGTWTMGLGLAGAPGGPISIVRIFPGSSAEKEGLRVGDQLVEFNGVAAGEMNPGVSRAAANGGKPVKMVVLREGRRVEATISPYQIP